MPDARQTEHQAWSFTGTGSTRPREPTRQVELDTTISDLEGKRRFVRLLLPQDLAAVEKHFRITGEAMAQRKIAGTITKRCLDHHTSSFKSNKGFVFARLIFDDFVGAEPRQCNPWCTVTPIGGERKRTLTPFATDRDFAKIGPVACTSIEPVALVLEGLFGCSTVLRITRRDEE